MWNWKEQSLQVVEPNTLPPPHFCEGNIGMETPCIPPTELGNKYFYFCERNIFISVKEILEWKHQTSNRVGENIFTTQDISFNFHSGFRTIFWLFFLYLIIVIFVHKHFFGPVKSMQKKCVNSIQRVASPQNSIYQYWRSWRFGLCFSLGFLMNTKPLSQFGHTCIKTNLGHQFKMCVTIEIYTFPIQAGRIWAGQKGPKGQKGQKRFKGFPTMHTFLQLAPAATVLGEIGKHFRFDLVVWILKGNNCATGVNDGASHFHSRAEKVWAEWK